MIAEGNETPGGEPAGGGEARGRRSEGDLLAERRARRAAESGEHALTLRAEAAEATVRTLETHVASLQQRLGDAEQEGRRIAEQLDPQSAARDDDRPGGERQAPREGFLERELQRASQREYAEQRLRVEAEDRIVEVQREARAESELLRRRLSASERDASALSARLEAVERELAEAEQAAATERAGMLRDERALRACVRELEGAATHAAVALEVERAARRRAERLLEVLRSAQRSALVLLGGLADTIARLREAALQASAAPPPPAAPHPAPQPPPPAREPIVQIEPPAPPPPSFDGPPPDDAPAVARSPTPRPASPVVADVGGAPAGGARTHADAAEQVTSSEMADALAAAVERLRARVEEQAPATVQSSAARPPHKHSMSLITRARLRLRRRRERRKQRN